MIKTIHSKMSKIVSQEITEMRKKSGLTQRELAQKLGREHSLVARIELGERRVDIIEFYLICEKCQVDPYRQIKKIFDKF